MNRSERFSIASVVTTPLGIFTTRFYLMSSFYYEPSLALGSREQVALASGDALPKAAIF